MNLDLHVGHHGRTTVVTVGGEVDLSTATQLRSCLDEVIGDGFHRIVMDLGATSFMDCAGLDALIEIANHLPDPGGSMAVARPSRLVDEMLTILHIEDLLPSFRTVGLACASQA